MKSMQRDEHYEYKEYERRKRFERFAAGRGQAHPGKFDRLNRAEGFNRATGSEQQKKQAVKMSYVFAFTHHLRHANHLLGEAI